MSSEDISIQVDGVSKCFNIYDRPSDRLKQLVMPHFRAATGHKSVSYHREYWALRDVSFEVKRGQTVGIIGQNGSGKSTLLQIITGTMTPTQGAVNIQGRIAALLELGSGFNLEFTGRENIFLNGSLLGLSRTQIEEKFDYIAAFADIGEHLEHPVKTYSSGMMLRLAFAVQVAVETEVLIIDEALAVGDARFQLKCFKRLEELKSRGTTILFVSHATELVRSFCDFGLVLNKGKPIYWGDAKSATVKYLASVFPEQHQFDSSIDNTMTDSTPPDADSSTDVGATFSLKVDPAKIACHTFGVGGAALDWLKIDGVGQPNLVTGGQEMRVECKFSWDIDFLTQLIASDGYDQDITLGIAIADKKGVYVFGCNGFDKLLTIDCIEHSNSTLEFVFKVPSLAEGDYFLNVAIALGNLNRHVQLKWYDCIVPLKVLMPDKTAFGLLAIDYEINRIK